MCVYSMVLDHYYEQWDEKLNKIKPTSPLLPVSNVPPIQYIPFPLITPQEIEEFRKLLDRARKYDIENNQPDCELEEKKGKLKKLAQELGIKIDFPKD